MKRVSAGSCGLCDEWQARQHPSVPKRGPKGRRETRSGGGFRQRWRRMVICNVLGQFAVATPIDPTGSVRPFNTTTGPRGRDADES